MPGRMATHWTGQAVGLAAAMAGRLAAVGLRGAGQLSWRAAAAACGVALAAALVAAPGEPLPESSPAAAVTGAVAPVSAVSADPAPPSWAPVARGQANFTLSAEADGQGWRFAARRDQNSTLREERFTAGDFSADRLFADLVLRRGQPARPAGSLFVETSRFGGPQGLAVARSQQPVALVTKFGPIETADLVLQGPGRERACIAFRHSADESGFRFQGVLCGAPERPADRRQLACLVDRIGLVSAGDDRDLRAHFSRAELARLPGCTPSKLEAAGRRVTWLDPEAAAPRLRR